MPESPLNPFGTGGRASVAGLVLDWESSVDARSDPEMFQMWLRSQSEAAKHASMLVPDLVQQYHGRGPTGQAGVPKEILDKFALAFEQARTAEAAAYAQFAADYAAHVDAAETELTQTYGREVLAAATRAHQGR